MKHIHDLIFFLVFLIFLYLTKETRKLCMFNLRVISLLRYLRALICRRRILAISFNLLAANVLFDLERIYRLRLINLLKGR